MYASRRWLIVLFLVAFVIARVTGAHLHLCLDGSEPLAQLHVSDTAEVDHHPHDAHHAGHDEGEHLAQSEDVAHEDVDVDAVGDVLGKIVKLDTSLVAMLACLFAIGLLLPARPPLPAPRDYPPRPPPRFLRPLLRGPPA